jgi:hypothetical protein
MSLPNQKQKAAKFADLGIHENLTCQTAGRDKNILGE